MMRCRGRRFTDAHIPAHSQNSDGGKTVSSQGGTFPKFSPCHWLPKLFLWSRKWRWRQSVYPPLQARISCSGAPSVICLHETTFLLTCGNAIIGTQEIVRDASTRDRVLSG